MPAHARRKTAARRARALWIGGVLLALAALGAGLAALLAHRDRSRSELVLFVTLARTAAQTGDTAQMRRLHLDDALMSDAQVRSFFAPFADVTDETLRTLSPDFDGDTYCWLRLPKVPLIYKLLHSQSGWYLQGEIATIDY